MNDDAFWDLIEDTRRRSDDPDRRLDLLRDHLRSRTPAEIIGFWMCLDRARAQVDTWEMWSAAERICDGWCSDDSFWYFQFWVVGLGRAALTKVAADPDALAEIPEVRRLAVLPLSEWDDGDVPEWECLDYVAAEAFDAVTGETDGLEAALAAAGVEMSCNPEPTGEPVEIRDAAEAARRLPRLSALFPLERAAA
ncbi:DUF4240 domain-containing protein [Streptomyces paludis]|uniref:DUF4240 domain-containing protein n=1 Tax=Streptomyces paludis TaxID=2282738 RepID=UPI0013B46696|nr:DUF4240 domain-containing protein [Streptomyces paludis]